MEHLLYNLDFFRGGTSGDRTTSIDVAAVANRYEGHRATLMEFDAARLGALWRFLSTSEVAAVRTAAHSRRPITRGGDGGGDGGAAGPPEGGGSGDGDGTGGPAGPPRDSGIGSGDGSAAGPPPPPPSAGTGTSLGEPEVEEVVE